MPENTALTIILVNYNSLKMKDIVEECIERLLKIKYRPLHIIIIDNGSSDGSDRFLEMIVSNYKKELLNNKSIDFFFLRLSRNLGFVGASIIGYELYGKKSKYIALLNNDFILRPNSIEYLIRLLDLSPKIAAVQGVILNQKNFVDNYGLLVVYPEPALVIPIGFNSRFRYIKKVFPVTFVDGAFSIFKTESLENCGGLFFPYFFMWGDDYELGIRLWRCGYVVISAPIIAGMHYGSATVSNVSGENNFMKRTLKYWYMYGMTLTLGVLYARIPIIELSGLLLLQALLEKVKLRAFMDGVKQGIKLRKQLYHEFPKLSVPREPRLKVKRISLLRMLITAYKNKKINPITSLTIELAKTSLNKLTKK